MGAGSEGRNITHQKKSMSPSERLESARNFNIPLSNEQIVNATFYKPADDSEEITYLKKRRTELGGFQPVRHAECISLPHARGWSISGCIERHRTHRFHHYVTGSNTEQADER